MLGGECGRHTVECGCVVMSVVGIQKGMDAVKRHF